MNLKNLHKTQFLRRASLLVLAAAACPMGAAMAQTAPAGAPEISEVVVTGTRIQSGFQTPTPVTTTSADQLKAVAPTNLADGLNQLPVFDGGIKTTNPGTTNVNLATGQNLLSLRGLGPARTLVLLDGRRLPATNAVGASDANVLPQGLVSRVDVVTGGASAAYGSDAVAGVVNYILDTHFEGLKAELQGGVSSRNDLPSGGITVSYGRALAEGRGHLILSGDYFHQDGLGADQDSHRDWFRTPAGRIPNPVTGASPAFLVIPDIRSSVGTFGGLISSGPLRGTQFVGNGVPAPFNFGAPSGSTFQSGGDGAHASVGLLPDQTRFNLFGHGEFDLNPRATFYAEGMAAYSHTDIGAFYSQDVGAAAQYTIFRDNAYLPASILQQMIANNLQSITLGKFEGDLPVVHNESIGKVWRGVVGVRGQTFADWKYDLSYTHARSDQELRENNLTINRRLYASADAVVNPATGQIVCRSTLSGLDPGCVPRDVFGLQAPNAAITNYVTGDNVLDLKIDEDIVDFNLSGDLGERFQLGAGPISVATGAEYRRESAKQTVDALSPTTTDFTGIRGGPAAISGKVGPYRFFNPLPFTGSYDISEAYIEVGVPVLKDLAFAKSLNLDGAARYADYSTSGGVTTWKLGVNYQVVDDLRLRITRSQDIRAPNLLELYNPASQVNNNNVYNGKTTQTLYISSGNAGLKPEKAETLTYGAVYRPGWAPGLQLSVDYYRIAISDAIATLGPQPIIDNCAAGNQALCQQITVTAAGTLIIRTKGLNLSIQQTSGIDYEAAYSRPLFEGNLSVRLLANHRLEDFSQAPGSAVTPALGTPSSPRWKGALQVRYAAGFGNVYIQERYIDRAVIDPLRVQGLTINHNDIPAIWYADIGGAYNVKLLGREEQLFLSINNLFDQKPPVSPTSPTTFTQPADPAYDAIGRYFSAGLRFKF